MVLEEYIDVKEASIIRTPAQKRFLVSQEEIVQYFSSVSTKSEVIDGLLKFGKSSFSNIAVFFVHSRSIHFLKGLGSNIRKNSHLTGYNVDGNTIVRRALITKFPYKGSIPVGSDEKHLFGRLFYEYPEEIFLYPGTIRGDETDILFYADSLEAERDSSIATFEYLVEKTLQAFKYLWVQKQLSTI